MGNILRFEDFLADGRYLKMIEEVKDHAIFLIDLDGTIRSWNTGCRLIKQWKAEEIIGQHYRILFIEDDQVKKRPEYELEMARKEGRYQEEGWRQKKDKSFFWASAVLTAIHNETGTPIGFIKVTSDLGYKKKFKDGLQHKNEQLIKINADLETFIYTASHDLKSPVNNIAGLVNLLNTDNKEDFDKYRSLSLISLEKLRETIDDLSQLTKVLTELEEEILETVSLHEMTEDVKYLFREEWKSECNIKEDFEIEEVYFSKIHMKSIFFNLLSNAVKYRSPERPCNIWVRSRIQDDRIVLIFQDNGIGFPQGFKEEIFTMYQRYHKHVEGTGVGLFVVKRIVDNAGGRIEVNSSKEGTEFRIFLKIHNMQP